MKEYFLSLIFLILLSGCSSSFRYEDIYGKKIEIPELKRSSIKEGDSNISLRPSIELEFTVPMNFSDVDYFIFLNKSEIDPVKINTDVINSYKVIITPTDYLSIDGSYTLRVDNKLISRAGFTLSKEIKINFLTTSNDTVAPKVIGNSFSDNSNDIAGNSNFIVYFSKPIDSGSLLSGIKLVDSKKLDVSIDISSSLNSIIIKPESVLKPWSDYTIKVTKDIRDETQNKNNLSEEIEYKITTKGDYRYRATISGSKYSFSPYFITKSVVNKTEYFYISRPENNCVSQYRLNTLDYENNNSFIYIRDIGGYGTAEGKMINPFSIVTDESGDLYVCDMGNNRIQKFNYKGEFLLSLGNKIGESYSLFKPYGIGYKNGSLYITDQNNRVAKYNKNGDYITSWLINELNEEEKVAKPIAIDNNEQIYIADNVYSGGKYDITIKKFDKNGVFLGSIINYQSLNSCQNVSVDRDNFIYIYNDEALVLNSFYETGVAYKSWYGFIHSSASLFIDENNFFYFCNNVDDKIIKYMKDASGFSLNYKIDFDFSDFNYSPKKPRDIAVDNNNNVYLTSLNTEVMRYSKSSGLVFDISTDNYVDSIVFDEDNNLFIGVNSVLSDNSIVCQIIKYDKSGFKISQWGEYGISDEKLNRISKIRFSKDRLLYVLDMKNKISIFTPTGEFVKAFGNFISPTGIAFDDYGNIFVSDTGDNIYIFDRNHNLVNTIDMEAKYSINYISDIVINKNGLLYISDYYCNKINIFSIEDNNFILKKVINLNGGHYASDIAVDENNDLYFTDENTGGFYIYDFVSD